MATPDYDVVFVGGGLAAVLLLHELRPTLPERVAVIDPSPLLERPTIHWSYWSREHTLYDRFAIAAWRQAKAAEMSPESIAPFTLRLVRSSDVFGHIAALLEPYPIEWLHKAVRSITRQSDELYEISTDAGTIRARWVFDSALDVAPHFPPPQGPQAVLSGTGIRVTADRPIFDASTATLFDPLDEWSFAYLLPLSPVEALVESASFGPVARKTDEKPLLRYLRDRYPRASFEIGHVESGTIPLGFAPSRTTGSRHILIGTKRGLVKPSAGYGLVRIARESEHLARLWREHRSLPPSLQTSSWWRLLDKGFLQLAAQDPRRPLTLLHRVMRAVPLTRSLRFIDEELPPRELVSITRAALPAVLRKP